MTCAKTCVVWGHGIVTMHVLCQMKYAIET